MQLDAPVCYVARTGQQFRHSQAVGSCCTFIIGLTILTTAFRLVDVQTSNFFTLRNDVVPIRGNPYKVLINVSRMNVRRHFFTERIALIWNSLPPSVVDFRTLLGLYII